MDRNTYTKAQKLFAQIDKTNDLLLVNPQNYFTTAFASRCPKDLYNELVTYAVERIKTYKIDKLKEIDEL